MAGQAKAPLSLRGAWGAWPPGARGPGPDVFLTRSVLLRCAVQRGPPPAASQGLLSELEAERDPQARSQASPRESAWWALLRGGRGGGRHHSALAHTPPSSARNAAWPVTPLQGQPEGPQPAAEEREASGRRLREQAAQQLSKEKEAWGKTERNRLLRVRRSTHLQKEHGLRHLKLVEDARRNHWVAVKFLKASLGRVQEQERRREREAREQVQRRMDAVLALKNSITANRETLRKFQAWGQARAELAAQKARAEKQAILAQGGNAFKLLFHQHRRQELEAQKRAFEEGQTLRKHEIVGRLLKEEAEESRRRRPPSPPATATATATATARPSLRTKTWDYLADVSEGRAPGTPGPVESASLPLASRSGLMPAVSSESIQGASGSLSWEDQTLVEPEICGLWNQGHKAHEVPKEEVDRKPVGGTKMEKDILARTVEQLRSRVVHKQVASGREFKGCPFNSKPKLIHFKDFDIGKVYKKRMTLINATYTINYCKLEGVDEHLRDFIHIAFDPPGPMSAGMSCEVLVTFKPMVEKDLEGRIWFLAQTGRFSVPLKCSIKQCSLSLDKELINFGSYVVGETASRVITLSNIGALGTGFRVQLESEPCELELSQSPVRVNSLYTYDERGLYEKVLPIEQRPEGNEPSLMEQDTMRSPESEDVSTVLHIFSEEQMEITLGEVTEGYIGPFSSIKVPIVFSPVTPGTVQNRFQFTFKNQQCPTLHFQAIGVAVDVPVWVPKSIVDLKICMFDRLYQDTIQVHTRSKAALRLKFEVCKELRGHMELLPETGYIQALSTYSVQLKFLPRHTLPEDAGKYFDRESRILEAPLTIRVADQVKPIEFTVHATVTTSDLELSPLEVDFGHCTIYEATRTPVSVCNLSLLPQEFGFVGVPKFVDIQPNDGFGTILPLETVELDLIFQPTKAKEYNFELVCKSEINRCFKMTCRAVGVHPPLQLSHYQVKFAATALYDMSVAALHVINAHVSMNSLTHSVPRIGSEEACPVGPTSFQFLLPPDSPITISPSVGTVLPGKKCLVQVTFRPVLSNELIRQQAIRAQAKDGEAKSHKEAVTPRRDRRRVSMSLLRMHSRERPSRASASRAAPPPQKQEIKISSEEYQVARATLARTFQGRFDKIVVPCVVASGDIQDRKGTEPLSFSPHNTLFLELWCPAVAPSIIVTSDKGHTISNFGDVAVGHRSIKKVNIQNISSEDLAVDFSVLNPNGPFHLLNPISKLPAGDTQDLVLSFSPHESSLAQETLDIITKRGTLTLTLLGTGVASMITCSIAGDVLNMGYVIARESVSSTFKLQNNSSLPIKFSVQLASLSRSRREELQQLPRFLTARAKRTEVVGTQNHSGQSVFSVVPVSGVMDPGAAQDFTVTFSPDHESLYFSDRLQVLLFDKKVSHDFLLRGAAREHMMFVEGGDPLDVPVESLTTIPTAASPERREGEPPRAPPPAGGPAPRRRAPPRPPTSASIPEPEELRPILVTLDYVQLDTDTPAPPATRELQVGCIRTTQLSAKKTVEFSLDSLAALQHKGFSIEPAKGSVERGQTRTLSISWAPPADFDPDHPLMASALLQLRGDVKETYKVFFVAQVLAGP
ncbi:cilia- and flagella-associated protein 74-like [Myotis daubentonii]|uniref:cilia- and flagella-associated protein 74-like n=1 Tax=Myotis daubentonii TaxID=98922 RepID=UPI002873EF85|nr:cilia- and flagella-associated protein 74-like [Myotis daubentonii]